MTTDPHVLPGHWFPGRQILGLTLAASAVCWVCIAWIDRPLALLLVDLSDTAAVAYFRSITNIGHSAIWYGLAGAGLAFSYWRAHTPTGLATTGEWQRRARSFGFVIVSMGTSALAVNALKIALGRYRPRFLFTDGIYDFAPFALNIKHVGFPSGHTQSIVAAMVAFGFLLPQWRYPFWLIATVVAVSRFITTTHFASDVIAGAFIAITTAWIMRRYFERDGMKLAWPSKSAS
ncbi:MAG: phosphatase PAP2 family protein [Rhodospirillaceae bacterium]|nr:phosphatase PAP2 family protein [Rhodospirillaceae bacterium]